MSNSDDDASSGILSVVVPDPIRRRFTWKLFGSVVVVMLVTALVGAGLYVNVTSTLDQQVEDEVTSTANLHANGLQQWMDGLGSQATLLSESEAFRTDDPSAVSARPLNRHISSRQGKVAAIHVVNVSNGTIHTSTNQKLSGSTLTTQGVPWADDNLSERMSRAMADGTGLFMTQPYTSSYTDSPVVGFLSPVAQNERYAILVEGRLTKAVSTATRDSRGEVSLYGPNGSQLFTEGDGNQTLPESSRDRNDSGLVTEQNPDGWNESTVLGHTTLRESGWTVAVRIPESQAYAVRNQISLVVAALVSVPLVAMGGVVFVFGRRAGGALGRLRSKADALADGDLDVPLERERADEIGDLTDAFDDMRDSLQAQISDARRARREAEQARRDILDLNEELLDHASQYSDGMAACADGDLTVRLDCEGDNEAMRQIATDFNEMVGQLEGTVGQLDTFADEVADTSDEVLGSSEAVRDASEQVAESIQKISMDARTQKEELASVSEAIADLCDDIKRDAVDPAEVEDRIQTIADEATEVATLSEEVMSESETVAAAAEEQTATLVEVSQRARDMKKYAEPLGKVLNRFKTANEQEFYFPMGPGTDEQVNRHGPDVDD